MIKSGMFNSVDGDRRYDAREFASYFAMFIGNGIFPNPANGFQVLANGNMNITLKAGNAWIYGYYIINSSDYNMAIDVADGVLNRIDRVVLRLDYLNRKITPLIKKGTFASSPIAPELKRDPDAYELAIADIYVGKGAIDITQANITDLRLNTNLCGIVHGTVNQVDTTEVFDQFQSWYLEVTSKHRQDLNVSMSDFEAWIAAEKAKYQNDFETWFQTIKDVLDANTAGNLLNKIGDLNALKTQNKSNLVAAVNEIEQKQNVNSVNFKELKNDIEILYWMGAM